MSSQDQKPPAQSGGFLLSYARGDAAPAKEIKSSNQPLCAPPQTFAAFEKTPPFQFLVR
jgi:hypothetical protein